MKTVIPALLASLLVTACAGATDTPTASAPASVAQAPAPAPAPVAQAAAPAPAPVTIPVAAPAPVATANLAAGQRAFESGCFACHDQSTIFAKGGRTRSEWTEVVNLMVGNGYSGSPAEMALVIDYLTATHPKT